jgi:hypothetical protein
MGDGRTFEQAVRALDKLIVELTRAEDPFVAADDPVQRCYERIVSGADATPVVAAPVVATRLG